MSSPSLTNKLKWNLPWMVRYPAERTRSFLGKTAFEKKHVIFTIADHFEPSWSNDGLLPLSQQKRVLDNYYELAQRTGDRLKDSNGVKFGHTFFYPAEQYDRGLMDTIAQMQAEGLGEVEIHLHHGVDEPDSPENLERQLLEFRDALAEDHKCLSRFDGEGDPKYAFVHGNLALANSAGGRNCGVDEEMKILADTGCYVDMTLASAPDRSQVPMINQIYECGNPLDEPVPHRSGRQLEVNGPAPELPIIFTGPLVLNWTRRVKGVPIPRLDDGALVYNQPMDLARLRRWLNANITVKGRSDWIFVKLYCHSFFENDFDATIGNEAVEFFSRVMDHGQESGNFDVHFASAREATNMVFAAIDGKVGNPHDFRDYKLLSIMNEGAIAGT
ncbi:MAG: hypothetical protein HKN33_06925 [Pyrinomonadaceae bacterium]|nr:hypothetical protein [Pyrinomonadaceae bacterium]